MVPQTLTYLLSAAIAATALPNAHNATAHPTVTLHPTSPHTPKTVFVGRALPEFNQDLFLGIKYADKPARFTPSAVKSVYAANDSNAGPYTGRVPGVGHSAVLYDATAYGNECPGYGSDETKLVNSGTIRLDEDCLNLNVIRPRTDDGALLPVMLWIFGGGWQQGATADPRYNMSYVVRQGELSGNPVLGVSINYRVAAFGFLDSEEVRAAGVNNLGLRDQRVAMRWVKDNIRAFGGDPDKVTIWGESAGAYSVGAHLVANGGDHEGLFRAAIMESGNAVGPPWNGTDWHQPMYDRIVNKTGCTSSANTLECLRNTPYELFYASANEGLEWFGAIDGAFIREYPQISMTAGRIAAVPILLGSNTDEGTSLGTTGTNTDEECIAQLISSKRWVLTRAQATKLLSYYPNDPAAGCPYGWGNVTWPSLGAMYKRYASMAGDLTMAAPRRLLAETMARQRQRVYSYRWDVAALNTSSTIGVGHFAEIPFVEILDWLSPQRGGGRHHEVRSRRTPGTGKWIFDTPAVREWLEEGEQGKMLWLNGPPGCGKSTMLSLIVDELKLSHTPPHAAVAYFYCDYRSKHTSPLVSALGGILRFLIESLDSIPTPLQDLFESTRREGRAPLPIELEELIHSISASFNRCYILVDAMDEFSIEDPTQTTQFIKTLDSLVRAGTSVLVTSRTLPAPGMSRSYIAHALHSDESVMDLLDSQLERDITNTVVDCANGMFLLAVLHLQNIRGQVTRSGVRKALTGLSGDLGDAYDKTFEAINHQSETQRSLALNTLMWVSASYRPLHSLELRHALATNDNDEDMDFDNIPPMKVVVRVCCGLIAVDDLGNDQSNVRLVHHTLHQYLQKKQTEWFCQAHAKIARTCLTYLSFKSLGTRPQLRVKHLDAIHHSPQPSNKWALTDFAMASWGYHAARAPFDSYDALASRLLKNTNRLRYLFPDNEQIKGLHVAAYFGLAEVTKQLLASGHRVDAVDSTFATPLHKACKYNHYHTAVVLLEAGAKPDHWSLSWSTPLFNAVTNKNHRLVQTLLEYGARVDLQCQDQWTALHKAADIGDLDTVLLLVAYDACIRSVSNRGLTALHRAAGRGHLEVMQFLIEHGAEIDRKTADGWTPLHGASSSGRAEAVKLLLKNGADIKHQSFDGSTALHRACRNGSVDTVKTLIEHGADVMAQDRSLDIPLHIAAREGHRDVIDCLLKQNPLQTSQVNKSGWTAYHEAELSGFHVTERLATDRSMPDADGKPEDELTNAIRSDEADKVQAILSAEQPDVESRDTTDRTLLHQALHAGSHRTARILLDAGADIHARSAMSGWQCIHYAAVSGSADCVRLCLERGADGNSRTVRGQTPLHHACRIGSEEIVQILLDHDVDSRVADDQRWRPVHTAAAAGHSAIVSKLLVCSASSWSVIDEQIDLQELQACAALRGHHGLVELIRDFRYAYDNMPNAFQPARYGMRNPTSALADKAESTGSF